MPLAASRLVESHGEVERLDLPGLALASAGLFGVVYGLVRSQSLGWSSAEVVISLIAGTALLVAFVIQELRTDEPMLPMEFFANRAFAVTNAVSLAMYFGMFGSIFFLSQFLQTVLHNSPLQAGVKLLVWTGAVMVVSPLVGLPLRALRKPAVHGRRARAPGHRPRDAGLARERRSELRRAC